MGYLKRFFGKSKKELEELLVPTGELTIHEKFLKIENYPFEPSIAFGRATFSADQIDDISYKHFQPTIRINEELTFLSAQYRKELEAFAAYNTIKVVKRPFIWEWILEPFLDTEYTKETDLRLMALLGNYGLTTDEVRSLRAEVETQMYKYNFDTMLWEWTGLNASDVLRAMRTKYNKVQFKDFYARVMKIALLPEKTDQFS